MAHLVVRVEGYLLSTLNLARSSAIRLHMGGSVPVLHALIEVGFPHLADLGRPSSLGVRFACGRRLPAIATAGNTNRTLITRSSQCMGLDPPGIRIASPSSQASWFPTKGITEFWLPCLPCPAAPCNLRPTQTRVADSAGDQRAVRRSENARSAAW